MASAAESHLGVDVSGTHFRADATAADRTRSAGALAMTEGSTVSFAEGSFSSDTAGRALVGHELTHVAQQAISGAPASQLACELSEQESGHEEAFKCADFIGDRKLEDCLNDRDRLKPGDTGDPVWKVQFHIRNDGVDVGPVDGTYGPKTADGVMAFKRKHSLGYETFSDVGPGTMRMLDDLCERPVPPGGRTPGDGICQAILTEPTLESVRAGDQTLNSGDSGVAVGVIQQALQWAGFPLPRYGADARFGEETASAVRSLQSTNGLETHGIVDSGTLGCIDDICTTRKNPPPSHRAWDINGNKAQALRPGATLGGLAQEITGDFRNWRCI